jgi:hypothetical protein
MYSKPRPVFRSWRQNRDVGPKEHVQVRKSGITSKSWWATGEERWHIDSEKGIECWQSQVVGIPLSKYRSWVCNLYHLPGTAEECA